MSAIRPWVSHMWYTWRSVALRVERREAVVSGIRVVRSLGNARPLVPRSAFGRRERRGWAASRAPLRGAGDDGVVHEIVHARESRLFAVLRVRRGGRAGRAEWWHRRASRRRVRAARRERREARALDRRSLRGAGGEGFSVSRERMRASRRSGLFPRRGAVVLEPIRVSTPTRVKTRVTPRSRMATKSREGARRTRMRGSTGNIARASSEISGMTSFFMAAASLRATAHARQTRRGSDPPIPRGRQRSLLASLRKKRFVRVEHVSGVTDREEFGKKGRTTAVAHGLTSEHDRKV